jgi:hypothetical protein
MDIKTPLVACGSCHDLPKGCEHKMVSSVAPTVWLAGFGKQTGLVNNLETWANFAGSEISALLLTGENAGEGPPHILRALTI